MSGTALEKLILDPAASYDQLLRVAAEDDRSLTLDFALPYLDLEELEVEGELYHGVTIPGGDLRGEIGQAGLPTVSRLIAVPENAAVSVSAPSRSSISVTGCSMRPTPRWSRTA